jgi:phage shock protein PspC (stress-responsive transcriptional regulator)
MSATAEARPAAPRLERPHRGRAIAGVSAGLGRHLNIDPILVRIAFVVLAAFGGAGFVAYVAGVLLIPDEGERHPMAYALTTRRVGTVIGTALLAIGAAATLGALIGDGLGHAVGWSVLLLGLGGYLVLRPFDLAARGGDTTAVTQETEVVAPPAAPVAPRRHTTRVVTGVMLLLAGLVTVIASAGGGLDAQEIAGVAIIAAGVAIAIGALYGASPWVAFPPLAIAAAVAALAASGVVLRGPIGDRTFAPAVASDLPGTYHVAIGQGSVDLRNIALPAGTTTHVKLKVGIGEAVVYVPAHVAVLVHGHSGVGQVMTPAGKSDGTDVDRDQRFGRAGLPALYVDAQTGIGQVRVVAP